MYLVECEQGSPEWFDARAGAITASNLAEIRKIMKSGPRKGMCSTAAENYAFKLAVERDKGGCCDEDQYQTWAMRRGNELEHDARIAHEKHLGGVFIEQAGIALTDDGKFGFSTDGFISEDGMSEYKCFTDSSKVREILFDGAIQEVIDQVQMGMWITGRKWCDFALYYPDLKHRKLDLTVNRIARDEEFIESMVEDLLTFDKLVESYIERIADLEAKTYGLQKQPTPIANKIPSDILGDLF